MRIYDSDKLSELVEKLECTIECAETLKNNKIDCLALCNDELYEGDDRLAFKFGKTYWGKSVTRFEGTRYTYYISKKEEKRAIEIFEQK